MTTLQYANALLGKTLADVEAATGDAPQLHIYSGTAPSDLSREPLGTLIAEFTLDKHWATAPGPPSFGVAASAAGQPGYFRVTDDGPAPTCFVQGSVGSGPGSDLALDRASLRMGETFHVVAFNLPPPPQAPAARDKKPPR